MKRRSTVSGELVAELRQLVERPLEDPCAASKLGQARLLDRVLLLLRERVHHPELLAAALEALELLGELVAVALRRLRTRALEPPPGLPTLGLQPGQLDVDGRDALRRLRQLPPQLDLAAAEGAQLGSELRRAREASLRARQLGCL